MKRLWSASSLLPLTVIAALQGCGDDSIGSSTLGAICGGDIGRNCAGGQYCAYEPGDNCGRADATATCEKRPEACPEIYAPVCGCDGKTYGNACSAAAAGFGYEREGSCESERMCGGIAGLPCPEGLFCFMDVGQCLGPDASGICQAKPQACDTVYAPVCGCDQKTYANACSAAAAGINVIREGQCEGK